MIRNLKTLFYKVLYTGSHFQARQFSNMYVFVYGTLKQNEPNHHWISTKSNGFAKFIGPAKTVKSYPLVIASDYNIPFLLGKPGLGHRIIGEVYEIDEKMLLKLDELEEHPSFYIREIDNIELLEDGREINKHLQCWVYFLKTFKESLLKLDFLQEYQSQGSHGKRYVPRYERLKCYHARSDVKD